MGGIPHPKGMIQEALPNWLEAPAQKLSEHGIFGSKIPNHVLVNEYQPGEGIMPHEDGPLFYPTIATINLGSHIFLDFYHHLENSNDSKDNEDGDTTNFKKRYLASLLLEPRSLLILKNDLYTNYLHGIQERTTDVVDEKVVNIKFCQSKLGDVLTRKTRISLTIRHVPKVLKVQLFKKK
ncbi:Alpha-ketoglutarate-dependent dioxygenase alkB-like protein 6 [Trichoplax sp. H2]|nr:Alpha-ketoglutarate-dependent dioxygenase alkB-like protein 6 [Trichoplax sp. H2]|eukprot:RDD44295.1 Alpha-ketoglutarate-dependent dioxygenase alkB-like protein 6 [Trichoplax sp. H2]